MRYVMIIAGAMLLVAGVWGSALAQTGDELIPIYKAAIEALNAHDLDQWATLFGEDVVFDGVPTPPPLIGREATKAYVASVIQGFPDFQDNYGGILTSGNILVVEEIYTGTHQEAWMGIPATGKTNTSLALVILEFEGNEAKREIQYWDVLGMMVNLGVIPAPELPLLEPSFTLPAPTCHWPSVLQ